MNIQITDMNMIVAFWLAFSRWLAVLMQLPLFDQVAIPVNVKFLTAIIVTYAFFPMTSGEILKDLQYMGGDAFWSLTVFNVLVGLVIGFFVKSLMNIFVAAGHMISQQVGFTALNYFDPNAQQQVGPFEKLIEWTVLMMIFTSGALLPMFKGVLASFATIHVYSLGKFAHSPEFFMDLFKSIFIISLMLSSPMIFLNILLNAVMGIVSKAVPQMNVITVSFAVNIGLGLLVFAAGSDEFFQTCFKIYTDKLGEWFLFIT